MAFVTKIGRRDCAASSAGTNVTARAKSDHLFRLPAVVVPAVRAPAQRSPYAMPCDMRSRDRSQGLGAPARNRARAVAPEKDIPPASRAVTWPDSLPEELGEHATAHVAGRMLAGPGLARLRHLDARRARARRRPAGAPVRGPHPISVEEAGEALRLRKAWSRSPGSASW